MFHNNIIIDHFFLEKISQWLPYRQRYSFFDGKICIFTSSDVHWTRPLLGHLIQSQSPEISCITWPLYKSSYTPRNSRITWPPYLNQTSLISRITRLICIYTSSDVHWTRALLGHLTQSQSPEISRIIWPLYKNSYIPRNSRITWPPYFKSESEEVAHYLATL